jgi:hypothetical protein
MQVTVLHRPGSDTEKNMHVTAASVPEACAREEIDLQRTSKSTSVISMNPSSRVGGLYLDAKPVNACFGSMVLDSGFI